MKICVPLMALFATGFVTPVFAETPQPPASLLKYVIDPSADTKQEIAARNVYALNTEMMGIYKSSLSIFTQNFLKKSNLIMGLFTGKGGRFILYRAGQPPLEAPTVPLYELTKSIGHAPMAVYEMTAPYVEDPKAHTSWIAPMQSFRLTAQIARDSLADLDVTKEQRELYKITLDKLIAFSDKALADGTFTYEQIETFAHDIETEERALTSLCAHVQVEHWFKVLTEWKKLLGEEEWANNTYGLSNSIYVTRQNNILFSVMAQFFGENAINNRLVMLETTSFQTTPEEMLGVFSHIVADRSLAEVFFDHNKVMDFELLGWEGRDAIEEQMAKIGKKAVLPPLVPLDSHEWPWRTDPTKGTGPKSFDDLRQEGKVKSD